MSFLWNDKPASIAKEKVESKCSTKNKESSTIIETSKSEDKNEESTIEQTKSKSEKEEKPEHIVQKVKKVAKY
jgi:hypothetical protein